MRLWKVVVLLNVALVVGVGLGYLRWAREVRELRRDLGAARETASTRDAADRVWTVDGVVRVVLAGQGVVVLAHESIPGLMQGMTMGFPVQDSGILDGLAPGDPVRFTLRQRGERLVVLAIEKRPAAR